jgi:hypothetical protein
VSAATDAQREALAAIQDIREAANDLGWQCAQEMELEDRRPLVKRDAIQRIMVRDGIAATPAEKIVETDEAYMQHRAKQRAAVVETYRARGAYEAAKLEAALAVEMLRVEQQNQRTVSADLERLERVVSTVQALERTSGDHTPESL